MSRFHRARAAWPWLALAALLTPACSGDAYVPDRRGVDDLVAAYNALDAETIAPRLAGRFIFRDLGLGHTRNRDDFLRLLPRIDRAFGDREMQVRRIGIDGRNVEVQGVWRGTEVQSGRRLEMDFSIEWTYDASGKIVAWIDEFTPRPNEPAVDAAPGSD